MKIAYLPCAIGPTSANPWFSSHQIDDLSIFCELEHQGNEVSVGTFYKSKRAELIWPRQLPKFFDPEEIKSFDMLIVSPKFPNLVSFLANPRMHSDDMAAYRQAELVIETILDFDGPVVSFVNDWRKVYIKDWEKDWLTALEKELTRDSHSLSEKATLGFAEAVKKVDVRPHSNDFDKWGAKWCLENLTDTEDKKYDFVFDGCNLLKDYSKERKETLLKLVEKHPNSATVGKLKIPGVDQLNNGRTVHGLKRLWPILTQAKYRPLSWEPFHIAEGRLWTPRTMFAMVSNSLAFTAVEGTPFLQQDIENLCEPTDELLSAQHAHLRNFAASDPWPVQLLSH